MPGAAETYAGDLNRADWPQAVKDLRKFASKVHRTEEVLVKKHNGDPQTLRWLTIAWAKQEGLVPQTLNRTYRHGRDPPFWAS